MDLKFTKVQEEQNTHLRLWHILQVKSWSQEDNWSLCVMYRATQNQECSFVSMIELSVAMKIIP